METLPPPIASLTEILYSAHMQTPPQTCEDTFDESDTLKIKANVNDFTPVPFNAGVDEMCDIITFY